MGDTQEELTPVTCSDTLGLHNAHMGSRVQMTISTAISPTLPSAAKGDRLRPARGVHHPLEKRPAKGKYAFKGANAAMGAVRARVKGAACQSRTLRSRIEHGKREELDAEDGASWKSTSEDESTEEESFSDDDDDDHDDLSGDGTPTRDGDANREDVDEDEDRSPEEDAPGEGHVGGEVPDKTAQRKGPPTFFDLPLELRWEIYYQVVAGERRHEVDIIRLADFSKIPPREFRKPKSYSGMLINHTSHHDNIEEIGKSHALVFFNLDELEGWLPRMQRAYFVILDLGEVAPRTMKKALRTLRVLPRLMLLEIRCTPKTLEAVRIPPAWDGFKSLERVRIRDRALERDIGREKHERAGQYARAMEIVHAIDRERETLDKDNYRVRLKLHSLPPRPSPDDLERRERETQKLLARARLAIRQDRSTAMCAALAIRNRPWEYSFNGRHILLGQCNKFLRRDVRQRQLAREHKRQEALVEGEAEESRGRWK